MSKNNVPQYDYDALFARICASDDAFPVDFDDAWQWIGYSRKQTGLDAMLRELDADLEYLFTGASEKATGGRPSDK